MRDWSVGTQSFVLWRQLQLAEIRKQRSGQDIEQFCASLYLAPPKSKKHLCARARVGTDDKIREFVTRSYSRKDARRDVRPRSVHFGGRRISALRSGDTGFRSPWLSLQETSQPLAGLVKLRFGTACRASQETGNLAVFVSNDVMQQENLLVTARQLADCSHEIEPLNRAKHRGVARTLFT